MEQLHERLKKINFTQILNFLILIKLVEKVRIIQYILLLDKAP